MIRKCPRCGAATRRHCKSATCPWDSCPDRTCMAVLDFRQRRGFRMRGDVAERIAFPSP